MSGRPHGTRTRYVHDRCRCLPCRAANADYAAANSRARQQGRVDLVDAEPTRQHLTALRDAGFGLRRIAAATRLSRSILAKIANGTTRRVRSTTARAIRQLPLSTACGQRTDRSSSREARRRATILARRGSRRDVAAWVTGNVDAAALQLHGGAVLNVATVQAIDALHHLVVDAAALELIQVRVRGAACPRCQSATVAGGRWCRPCLRWFPDRHLTAAGAGT